MDAKTTTVASGVLTSTGNFEATEAAAYGIIEIDQRSKTALGAASANIRLQRMIASRDSDNQITTTPTTLTDEASAVYYWKTYTGTERLKVTSTGTEVCTETWYAPNGGLLLPNLILGVLSASAKVHIYI